MSFTSPEIEFFVHIFEVITWERKKRLQTLLLISVSIMA
jgi:hypothetical protein